MRNIYKILAGKLKVKKKKITWKDNIKMDLKKMKCKGIDWIHLAQNRMQWWTVMNKGMNHWVP